MSYLFFFSYARDTYDDYLGRFFQDLQTDVRNLPNHHSGSEFGYLDQNRGAGEEWDDQMMRAVASAEVLVSMYSPVYFQRPNCGKEVQIFLERRKRFLRANGVRPANIIPVLWYPCGDEIPKTLPNFLYNDEPGTAYEREGLQYVASVGNVELYRRLVRKFARRIIDAAHDYRLPALNPPPRIGAVSNAFEPMMPPCDFDSQDAVSGPDSAVFAYVRSPDWRSDPFAPPDSSAFLYVASAIATGREILPHQFTFDPAAPDVLERLDSAVARNSLVVLMVDAAGLDDPNVCAFLQNFDARNFDCVSTMILWPSGGRTSRRLASLQASLPSVTKRRAPFFFPELDSAASLCAAIENSLASLQSKAAQPQRGARGVPARSAYANLPQLIATRFAEARF